MGRNSRCISTGKSILLVLWKQQEKGLDWEKMVHVEEHRLHQIYQFINLFTDVPEITAKIKRRRYLDPILTHIKENQKHLSLLVCKKIGKRF